MNVLDAWTRKAADDLGIDPSLLDQRLILDAARAVAHGVTRPAAPLGTYLLGVLVGRGATPAEAAEHLTRLAQQWPGPGSAR